MSSQASYNPKIIVKQWLIQCTIHGWRAQSCHMDAAKQPCCIFQNHGLWHSHIVEMYLCCIKEHLIGQTDAPICCFLVQPDVNKNISPAAGLYNLQLLPHHYGWSWEKPIFLQLRLCWMPHVLMLKKAISHCWHVLVCGWVMAGGVGVSGPDKFHCPHALLVQWLSGSGGAGC